MTQAVSNTLDAATTISPLRSGFVAITGRPNVGKSSLLNRILGFKLASTSSKPQTTRHRVHGVKTTEQCQTIYVDTPGFHRGRGGRKIFKLMNKTAVSAMKEVNAIVFVCESMRWTPEDDAVLQAITNVGVPVILCINKVDKVLKKDQLLPFIQQVASKADFVDVIAVSGKHGHQVEALETLIENQLETVDAFYFPKEQQSLESDKFFAAEMVREQVMRQLGDELPYSTVVEIETFTDEDKLVRIHAIVWVERSSQKGIVIGKGGERLKNIGSKARHSIESRFGKKVFLKLLVRVREGWSDDERALRSFGYLD